jgi:hypothetical protein
MVRERPGKVPRNRRDLDDVGTALERESRYKGSGGGGGKGADRSPGEDERTVPERPVGVPSLGAERGVHDHDLGRAIPFRDLGNAELHRSIRGASRSSRDRDERRVDIDTHDGFGPEQRGTDRKTTGSASEVEDRAAGEPNMPVQSGEQVDRGLRGSRYLLEGRGRAWREGDRLNVANELVPAHDVTKPSG